MSTINLLDPSKNSKDVQRGLEEWRQANPAEIIECMQRRGELKSLKAESYDRARPVLKVGQYVEPDENEGHGFKTGDRVEVTELGRVTALLTGGLFEGTITGIRKNTIRVNRDYYDPKMWRKVDAPRSRRRA